MQETGLNGVTDAGREAIDDIADTHGFSRAAVASLLQAMVGGMGSMAQFNHPELGGRGQWMRGGMIMTSTAAPGLSARVDALCHRLAELIAVTPTDAPASQNAGQGRLLEQLGQPDSSGAQGGLRYAFFREAQRLAVELDGEPTVYDTLDHLISGVSQQSGSNSPVFRSQHGIVDLATLPVVFNAAHEGAVRAPTAAVASDVFTAIEKLAALHAKGIVTDEEFSVKKTELLARL